jgi:hypothetical protein
MATRCHATATAAAVSGSIHRHMDAITATVRELAALFQCHSML